LVVSAILLLGRYARRLRCARIARRASRRKASRWVAVALTAAESAGLHHFRVATSLTEQHHEIRGGSICQFWARAAAA
jgi:hypothetical protein